MKKSKLEKYNLKSQDWSWFKNSKFQSNFLKANKMGLKKSS